MKHGTTGYRYGCRCDECKTARRAYMATWNAANTSGRAAYAADYHRRYRRKLLGQAANVSGLSTARRIEALYCMGWTGEGIAAHSSRLHRASDVRALHKRARLGTLRPVTVKDFASVYDLLCMKRGPSKRTATRAKTLGYAPPLAWDDDTIDSPEASPNYGKGRSTSAVDSTLDLLSMGETREGIAARLGVTRSAVDQYVSRANGRNVVQNTPSTEESAA